MVMTMTEVNEALGSIGYIDGNYVAKLECVLERDQDAVWSMLTEPARIVEWLAPGEIELRGGGSAKLNFVDSGIVIDSIVSESDSSH
jgi:hypothetical protein